MHRRSRIVAGLIVAILLFSSCAGAEILIKYMAFLKGQCTSAKHDDKDFTEQCRQGVATNTFYQNGRVSFGFVSDHPISFLGTKDFQPSKDQYVLEVDQATTIDDGKLIVKSAVGSCSVSGDIAKQASIKCEVTIENQNRYLVVFDSIGNAELIYGTGFEPFDIENNIAFSIREFDRVYTSSGIDGVETYLKACYPGAVASRWLPAVIKCVSIDFAGNQLDMLVAQTRGVAAREFFTESAIDLRVREYLEKFGTVNQPEKVEKIIKVTKGLSIKTLHELIRGKKGSDLFFR